VHVLAAVAPRRPSRIADQAGKEMAANRFRVTLGNRIPVEAAKCGSEFLDRQARAVGRYRHRPEW